MIEVRFLDVEDDVVAKELIDGEAWGEFYRDDKGMVRYRFEDDIDLSANATVEDLRRSAEVWSN
jgi:hypothetical protein